MNGFTRVTRVLLMASLTLMDNVAVTAWVYLLSPARLDMVLISLMNPMLSVILTSLIL
jgi:hypothetical protein